MSMCARIDRHNLIIMINKENDRVEGEELVT